MDVILYHDVLTHPDWFFASLHVAGRSGLPGPGAQRRSLVVYEVSLEARRLSRVVSEFFRGIKLSGNRVKYFEYVFMSYHFSWMLVELLCVMYAIHNSYTVSMQFLETVYSCFRLNSLKIQGGFCQWGSWFIPRALSLIHDFPLGGAWQTHSSTASGRERPCVSVEGWEMSGCWCNPSCTLPTGDVCHLSLDMILHLCSLIFLKLFRELRAKSELKWAFELLNHISLQIGMIAPPTVLNPCLWFPVLPYFFIWCSMRLAMVSIVFSYHSGAVSCCKVGAIVQGSIERNINAGPWHPA